MFHDRTDAGRQLVDLLDREDVEGDIVLAIPRGGLPVARPVADFLDAPLEVVVASKIGAPDNPELALGAATADGSSWLNEDVIERLDVPKEYVDRERERQAENAREKVQRYRDGRGPPDLAGKRVVVVDDGIATGATVKACLRQVVEAGAEHVTLAVPVAAPGVLEDLWIDADEVVAVESPPHFTAVGQFYEEFGQISDEEAMTYLDASGGE